MENGYNENDVEVEVFEEIEGEEEKEEKEPKLTRIWSVLGLILAIASVVLCFVPALSITLGAASIVLSLVSRAKIGYFDSIGVAALIIGIFGTVFGCAYIVLDALILSA